jgi:hypothetical protein
MSFSDFSKSTMTGFDGTTVTAIPLNSSLEAVNLNVSVAFRPEILFGLNMKTNLATMTAGIFIDLPRLSTRIQPLSGVNQNCTVVDKVEPLERKVLDTLGNMTSITSELGVGVGLQYTLSSTLTSNNVGDEFALPKIALPAMQPACLVYDKANKTFVPAEAKFKKVLEEMQASASATPSATSSAGGPSVTTAIGSAPPNNAAEGGKMDAIARMRWTGLALGLVAVSVWFL